MNIWWRGPTRAPCEIAAITSVGVMGCPRLPIAEVLVGPWDSRNARLPREFRHESWVAWRWADRSIGSSAGRFCLQDPPSVPCPFW